MAVALAAVIAVSRAGHVAVDTRDAVLGASIPCYAEYLMVVVVGCLTEVVDATVDTDVLKITDLVVVCVSIDVP